MSKKLSPYEDMTSGCINRKGFLEMARLMIRIAQLIRQEESRFLGEESPGRMDVTFEHVGAFLHKNRKCRVIFDMDPARDKVFMTVEEDCIDD